MIGGYRAPGNGMTIAAIANTLKTSDGSGLICDKIVTGKPNPKIVDLIRAQHEITCDLSRMVMIGDRVDTDIMMGNLAKIHTCLVLTGVVTSEKDLAEWQKRNEDYNPTWILESFGEDIHA
jgi:glycerol 3-phosphatase-2